MGPSGAEYIMTCDLWTRFTSTLSYIARAAGLNRKELSERERERERERHTDRQQTGWVCGWVSDRERERERDPSEGGKAGEKEQKRV